MTSAASTKRPKRPTPAQTAAAKPPKRPAKKKAAKKKVAKKKASKSTTNKNSPQTRRDVPAHIPRPSVQLAQTAAILRLIAATDFLADPDGHSVRWHYEREDRLYEKTIAWRTFEDWSLKDKWVDRRLGYWQEIEDRVRENMADEFLRRRLADLEKFERRLDAFDKFLDPLVNKETGEVIIDEETGMPKFALEMPSMDKFMAMYLKLHERVLLLRGEATARTEQLSERNNPDTADSHGLNQHLKQPAAIPPNFSRRDLRSMATQMLRVREPALGGTADEDIIDAPVEKLDATNEHDDPA